MVNLQENEKRKLVIEACKSAYAHDFIERLPSVSIYLSVLEIEMLLTPIQGI